MKQPWSVTLGLFLERFGFLHPLIMRYSHDFNGRRWYVNRVSGTMYGKERKS